MADVTLLHNSACSTSRHALDEVQASESDVTIVNYLKTPLDRDELLDLIGRLADPAADLVRKDSFFAGLGLNEDDYVTADAVADLLAKHPRLMQRPVLIKDGRAIIGRPKDRVATFLQS